MRAAALALACLLPALAACGDRDVRHEPPPEKPLPKYVTAMTTGGFVYRSVNASGDVFRCCTEFDAVRAPSMHHGGERLCFLGREEAGDPWRLYTLETKGLLTAAGDTPRPTALDVTVDEESAPAWLPDDRIVYSARAIDASRALFVVDPTAGAAERITFSGTDARDPWVLKDGRVLYAGTRTTPAGARAPALLSVHPDGTGVLLFHGATPGSTYARPRQGLNGDVVFLVRAGQETHAWVADWRAPSDAAEEIDVPGSVVLAEPEREGRWLVGTETGTFFRVAAGRLPPAAPQREPLQAGPRWPGAQDACNAERRPRPQGYSSMLKPDARTGGLLCVDARRGVHAAAGFVRLFARVLQPDAGAFSWEQLGRVPLEADGSFFATVPADTPLRLDVLGAAGGALRTSKTPFWVRPGETRGCTGCHDAPDTTPPNVRPAAALEEPVVPRLAPEGGR